MMFCIRPIQENDFESFVEMAFEGQAGITNLPKDRNALQKLLKKSVDSFQEKTNEPKEHLYLFVLEELPTMQLVGVSGIFSRTSHLNYFRISEFPLPTIYPDAPSTCKILERVHYPTGPSEIGALYLRRAARKSGLGKLLSLSRFLFMAAFPERFTPTVFAELRGVIDPDGESPFWNGVGRHFLPISFVELMHRRDQGQTQVAHLMPTLPLYIDLLPPEVIQVLGEAHPHTQPALRMLTEQGFRKTGEIDLFDAGPRLMAERTAIKTIAEAKKMVVKSIKPTIQAPNYLLSNNRLAFRALMGPLQIEKEGLCIDQKVAHALEVKEGDTLIYCI